MPAPAEYIGGVENSLVPLALDTVFQQQPKFNPIVFFGPTGTGKSLLVQLIATRWKRDNRTPRMILTTGADFAREYAHAVEADSLPDLRSKYRRAGLVAIDDIHEIGDKTPAQNELVRTLDALLARHQPVVVTLPQSPTDAAVLLPSLASRLSAGLTVPLHPPGPAARRLILRALASARSISLSDRVLDLVASDALKDAVKPGTVPRLLQTLLRLEQFPFASQASISEHDLRRCLQDPDHAEEPQLQSITKRVSKYFNLRSADLRGKTRQQRVVRARGVAMFLARKLTANSLESVGRHFGNRDHTTVLHACRKTESLIEEDPSIRQAVEDLKTELTAH
ncbi:MAG: AAA family ATPase [Candidatus Anammoximicrobium sp.]|nr:AAA family ATPase [Candidatus Anammoximicrobium sp.]